MYIAGTVSLGAYSSSGVVKDNTYKRHKLIQPPISSYIVRSLPILPSYIFVLLVLVRGWTCLWRNGEGIVEYYWNFAFFLKKKMKIFKTWIWRNFSFEGWNRDLKFEILFEIWIQMLKFTYENKGSRFLDFVVFLRIYFSNHFVRNCFWKNY